MLARRAFVLLSLAFVATACGGDPAAPTGEGTVTGVVTAGDGVTPVALATVYAQSLGASSGTTSDASGSYTLPGVPAGQQLIVAEKGNFRSTTSVNVAPNATTTAPAAKLAPTGKLGYVQGAYDSIEDIIQDLGYAAESVTHSGLASSATLSQYKMIFLNCGAGVSTSSATVNALKAWVQAGGTLYASDWELDVVQAMFPEHILGIGSGDEQVITATITNTDLQQFTGKATASIAYDLGAWKMLQSISATPSVLLRGTVTGYDEVTFEPQTFQNQALAIAITHGQGRVVYTTFHNEAGVTADQLAVLRFFIHY